MEEVYFAGNKFPILKYVITRNLLINKNL